MGVVTIGVEADDRAAAGAQHRSQLLEHHQFGVGGDVHHHIAGHHDDVVRRGQASGGQGVRGEVGQVQPRKRQTGVLALAGLDQQLIGIHADGIVTAAAELGGNPAGAAPCVEDHRPTAGQRVDEPRFSVHVLTAGRDPLEAPAVRLALGTGSLGRPAGEFRAGWGVRCWGWGRIRHAAHGSMNP